ncbi:hypothetical protein FB451DRAFT_1063145 [Mycena latifolia]|nr:hypothetical protein FB451DRAFT_1063145 [Mycena latifolia]
MSANLTFPILTPDTPLAFLDRSTGLEFEASGYLYIATLSAYIWDLLSSIPEEIKIFRVSNLSLPLVAYFLSRVATLGFIVTATIFQVAPVGNCPSLTLAIGWCFAAAVPATASLFFFRIAAVFNANKPVVLFFLVAWIATLGSSLLVPFAVFGGHIASTPRCINTAVKPFGAAGTIANACTDTLVFVALSWRLTFNGTSPGLSGRSQSFVRGKGLPRLSKLLLQSGQLYYLATVGLNILTMVMLLDPSLPPVLHAMFAIPNVALENAMACRVFRALRLGFIPPDSESEITTSVLWASFVVNPPRTPADALVRSGNYPLRDTPRRTSQLNIHVTKSFETADDVGQTEDVYSRKDSQGGMV